MNDNEREAARVAVSSRLRLANSHDGRARGTSEFDGLGFGLSVAAIGSASLLWFHPFQLTAAFCVSIAIVLAWPVLVRIVSLQGLWARPHVLLFLGAGVLFRAVLEVQLVSPVELALPSLVAGVALAFALGSARLGKRDFVLVALAVSACVGGLLALADRAYDSARPEQFLVRIDAKEISRNRGGLNYHLILAPVTGPAAIDLPKMRVAKDFHDSVDVGGTMCFAIHPGALRMRWYDVSLAAQCPAG